MLRHAVCDQDGRVINVVIWDGESNWFPHDPTHYVVEHDECDIHDQHCIEDQEEQQVHWFEKGVHSLVLKPEMSEEVVRFDSEKAQRLSTQKKSVSKKQRDYSKGENKHVLSVYY